MINPLHLTRNDLQPYYRFNIPNVSNLIGANVTCTMVDRDTGRIKINRRSIGCVITNASNCDVEYRWQLGDTDTTATYKIEFEITPPSGGKFTLPSKKQGVAFVIITDDLDGV